MNLIKFSIVFGIIALSAGLIGEKIAYGEGKKIFEDQSFICKHVKHTVDQTKMDMSNMKHEYVCITVNDDDVLSQKGLDETMKQFQSDLDTFSIHDITGDSSH